MSLRVVVFVAVARGQERTLLGSRPLTVLMRTTKALSFFKIWGAVRRGWAACTLFPGLLVSRLWHPRLTGQLLVPQREDPIVGGGGRASASLPGPLCRCGRQGTQPRSTSAPSSASRDYKVSHDEHGRRYCVENK